MNRDGPTILVYSNFQDSIYDMMCDIQRDNIKNVIKITLDKIGLGIPDFNHKLSDVPEEKIDELCDIVTDCLKTQFLNKN